MTRYAHPEVLVDPQWVAEHLHDPTVHLVEAHLDPVPTNVVPYHSGHIPGAVLWDGLRTILLPSWRVNFDRAAVEGLLSRSGIANGTTVVVYSDHPAVAPWVFWFLKAFGHEDVRVLNGGRKKWLAEGRPLTTEVPTIVATSYKAKDFDPHIHAMRDQVQTAIGQKTHVLLDVRTPQEYRGEWFMMSPPAETERAGHIPGAVHLYYESALLEDGTFRSADELAALYGSKGVTADKEAITYCAIGIRSAHTWFVLKYLLGYQKVLSYDGSWNEWGRLPYTPIET